MNDPLAQLVALTCHANAALAGASRKFFPDNSTCKFCESVRFVVPRNGPNPDGIRVFTLAGAHVDAATPDEWFATLRADRSAGVQLSIGPDWRSGGTGGLGVLTADGETDHWFANWEVGDNDAPDRRIWRVSYVLWRRSREPAPPPSDLAAAANRLRAALTQAANFAARQKLERFVRVFETTSAGLGDPLAPAPYHGDLWVDGFIREDAKTLLNAAQAGWVFGGMGSWNDMSFERVTQTGYEQVSADLYGALQNALMAAANSSLDAAARGRE